MSKLRIHIEAMLAAALASGVLVNTDLPASLRKYEPDPVINSSRNDRRTAKRKAQRAARKRNRK